jgi:ribosomal protein S14
MKKLGPSAGAKTRNRVLVKVTAEDIRTGLRDSAYSCPIAIALCRRGFRDAAVGTRLVHFGHKAASELPPKAKKFVSEFDGGQEVKPMSFHMPIPPEVQS